jgi:hypothetical protein
LLLPIDFVSAIDNYPPLEPIMRPSCCLDALLEHRPFDRDIIMPLSGGIMIHTRICDLLGIPHPIVLGGMGTATSPPLVAAVSNGGGFGTLGTSSLSVDQLERDIASIRERTDKPFGINHLLFLTQEDMFRVTLRARPKVIAFAWPRLDQDLREYFRRAHDAGAIVMHMAGEVPLAVRAAEAGADIIVAQGTEAGGHVGWMASMPLVPMIVKAVAPLPVLAAGGIADGRGLAASLALGAEGVLLGTRFWPLRPIHELQAGDRQQRRSRHALTSPDIVSGRVWPGADPRTAQPVHRTLGRPQWALASICTKPHKRSWKRAAPATSTMPPRFGQTRD